MSMVAAGQAYCVQGNHDVKLVRWLEGRSVQMTHGLEKSAEQFMHESKGFKDEVAEVRAGQECGMAFENYDDIREGDVIEIFTTEEIERTL